MKVKLQLQRQFGTDEEHLHLQVDGQKNGRSIPSSLSIQLLFCCCCFLFGATTNPPPFFAGGMSSKFQRDGVVYISASSSKRWVLDVGAPKPRSSVN